MSTHATPQIGLDDPLNIAVTERDKDTMHIVRQAIHAETVMLAYQPIVQSARPDLPAFYEGLLRVLDQNGRVIPAREFMHLAETSEVGRELDCLAMRAGLRALFNAPDIRISLNMSARSIGYPKWKETLMKGLKKDPTIAERLILEISESSAMLMPDLVCVFMLEMQALGVSFALDDFGSSYTVFRHFKEFSFDIVKIDGAFTRGIATDPANQVMMQALISLASHFDMYTVAEFVETAGDANYLTNLGVHCLQGHYFGVPTLTPDWEKEISKQSVG
jgi:EAL domain-containing protein (putative c-di-GMP-specific phosphodiesterase class I)